MFFLSWLLTIRHTVRSPFISIVGLTIFREGVKCLYTLVNLGSRRFFSPLSSPYAFFFPVIIKVFQLLRNTVIFYQKVAPMREKYWKRVFYYSICLYLKFYNNLFKTWCLQPLLRFDKKSLNLMVYTCKYLICLIHLTQDITVSINANCAHKL